MTANGQLGTAPMLGWSLRDIVATLEGLIRQRPGAVSEQHAGTARVLPDDPTPEMIEAGQQVLCQLRSQGQLYSGIRTADDARDLWRAMRAAAPADEPR